jgi:hypothetical protein
MDMMRGYKNKNKKIERKTERKKKEERKRRRTKKDERRKKNRFIYLLLPSIM